ncbi:SRPBCC family protein [Streptomyces cadmiisoli]|uniref:SRPBCC family protein n=1 Tax=Streptomyces cadmiisoli TaxID=2184053 RepID=UPI0036466055
MAIRHRLIKAPSTTVWAVLADGNKYPRWVVGPSDAEPVRGQWPHTGAAIRYEASLGPLRLSNETVVRRCKEGSELELEAYAGPLGTARIDIELRQWGEHCLVLVDEHPLQGTGGLMHNAGFEIVIQLRHRAMLRRLARLCEEEAGDGASRTVTSGDARAGTGAGRA